ncbi:MAG TPA: metal-dependent hydrolase [Saprospiraceae bacterium]|nr:metal-dependent hydrolase [Saprospiraceae bacterium]
MKVRYFGHSCFEIRTKGKIIIVDPFISGNPLASAIRAENLKADYLLITHGHGDHIGDAVEIAKRNGSVVISNFEVVTWFGEKGIEGHGMNLGGKHVFDFGIVKYVNAVHSSTLPDNSPGGNPGGFVLWNEEACLYIAGDTALTQDMQLIPMTCPKLSAAILPLGDNFTMGYEDALIVAGFIQCDRIIGCHFDTFDVIKVDHFAAKQAFATENKELILLNIGEDITI